LKHNDKRCTTWDKNEPSTFSDITFAPNYDQPPHIWIEFANGYTASIIFWSDAFEMACMNKLGVVYNTAFGDDVRYSLDEASVTEGLRIIHGLSPIPFRFKERKA